MTNVYSGEDGCLLRSLEEMNRAFWPTGVGRTALNYGTPSRMFMDETEYGWQIASNYQRPPLRPAGISFEPIYIYHGSMYLWSDVEVSDFRGWGAGALENEPPLGVVRLTVPYFQFPWCDETMYWTAHIETAFKLLHDMDWSHLSDTAEMMWG